jgi:light-regulated signal transduction histidine kinase (bacteriophytochrome)
MSDAPAYFKKTFSFAVSSDFGVSTPDLTESESFGPFGGPLAWRDITGYKQRELDLRRATRELARARAELEQFALAAGHELKEPLRVIRAFSEQASEAISGTNPEAESHLRVVADGVKRMNQVIDDVLRYAWLSRTPEPSAEGFGESADLNESLHEALQTLEAPIDAAGAVVVASNLPTVKGHRRQFAQVFQNLIANSLKFHGPSTPYLWIGVNKGPAEDSIDGQQWTISVKDNGLGFEPSNAERIFHVFERQPVRQPAKSCGGGNGIGLAIVRRIVEQYGGRTWASSQPGKGATFYFTLPA